MRGLVNILSARYRRASGSITECINRCVVALSICVAWPNPIYHLSLRSEGVTMEWRSFDWKVHAGGMSWRVEGAVTSATWTWDDMRDATMIGS